MSLELNSLLLERYRILAELGRGGMGAVYRGYDENLGVEVAIKENLFVSPEFERQFKREATLLASLRHPHLPRVTDHFVIPDRGQYLVMDFIAGQDARQLLEERAAPLPEDKVTRWGREILSALNYLHTRPQPIVHRDIKPGNIKITPDGRAVLVDFGLAKIHDAKQTTTVGAKALTPGFAPPEQYGLGRTDARTDLYSLGATLYTLLTNKVPTDSLERAMGRGNLIPLRELNPTVSPKLATALEKALAVKPDDRFANAAEFAAALATDTSPVSTILHQATPTVVLKPPPTPVQATQPPPVTPQGNRWLLPVIIIGVVLFLVGGGGMGLLAAGLLSSASSTRTPTPPPSATDWVIIVASTETPTPDSPTATEPSPTPPETPTITPTSRPLTTPQGGGRGQIAFVSERAGAPQVFAMNVDGSNEVQLTDLADGACQPEWSPDGARLLFVTPCSGKKETYPRSAIYIMDVSDTPEGLQGSNVQPFIVEVGGAFDPDWSATSGIAFTHLDNNDPRIYIADPATRQTQIISRRNSNDSQPSWSPDGEQLVFMNTSRAGRPTLYWMNKDGSFSGSQPAQVTRDVDARSPAWSPEGKYIAYTIGTQIYLVPWDTFGFEASALTILGPNADPVWSADGRWMVFESWQEAANHDIYLMTSIGSQQTRLTDDPALDYHPAWRP